MAWNPASTMITSPVIPRLAGLIRKAASFATSDASMLRPSGDRSR
jgi:hypothetical protein